MSSPFCRTKAKPRLLPILPGLLAAKGAKTLLIDGDLRNPGLSRALSLSTQRGLVKAVMDGQPWQNSVKVENKTKLAIIPTVLHRNLRHTSEILSSPGMKKLLDEARDCVRIHCHRSATSWTSRRRQSLRASWPMVSSWWQSGASRLAHSLKPCCKRRPKSRRRFLGWSSTRSI